MRVELKTTGIVAVTHNLRPRDPHSLKGKLTLLFELHQDRRIHHFLIFSQMGKAKDNSLISKLTTTRVIQLWWK